MPGLLAVLRRLQLVDRPNPRSSHRRPTLRGGGVAPAIGVGAGLAVVVLGGSMAQWWLVVAGTVAAAYGAMGLADDLVGVDARLRLGLQGLVAVVGLFWLDRGLTGPPVWVVAFSVVAAVWLVGYVNAFNFMDGINGISAAQVLVAGATWWGVGAVEHRWDLAAGGALAVGAAAGFLPFNVPRALVFLGDVGSYFLGALLAVLVVVGVRRNLPPEAVACPLLLYVADTATTVMRRIRAGEIWHSAHRSHAYQRLTQLGWSHSATTGVVAFFVALVSGLGTVSLTGSIPARVLADIAVAGVLAAYLCMPAVVARRLQRSAGARLSPAPS